MNTYSFIYRESKEKKDLWKNIKCKELIRHRITGTEFYKVTIIEDTAEALERTVSCDENYFILLALLDTTV